MTQAKPPSTRRVPRDPLSQAAQTNPETQEERTRFQCAPRRDPSGKAARSISRAHCHPTEPVPRGNSPGAPTAGGYARALCTRSPTYRGQPRGEGRQAGCWDPTAPPGVGHAQKTAARAHSLHCPPTPPLPSSSVTRRGEGEQRSGDSLPWLPAAVSWPGAGRAPG